MTVEYVIVIDARGNEAPIVFPVGTLRGSVLLWSFPIVSAGFATKAVTGLWFAHGEGGGVQSRPVEDGILLNTFFDYIV